DSRISPSLINSTKEERKNIYLWRCQWPTKPQQQQQSTAGVVRHAAAMSASGSDDQIPVRDGYAVHPKHTAPEEMYWLSHLNQEELCEKYVGLRDDFYTLKKFSCKQEDKIKKLQTKLRKIIADKKKDTTSRGNASCSVQEMEYQDALESQQQSIRELRLKNDHLEVYSIT
ncbi:hypothetical protein OTU49_017133, partial [Cherax quadricarinatus]